MQPMTCDASLASPIEGGALEFEVIRLSQKKALAVVRRLKVIGIGLIEMTVLFDSRDAFMDWIATDEYRHHAPRLMAFVRNRFDSLYCSAEEHR